MDRRSRLRENDRRRHPCIRFFSLRLGNLQCLGATEHKSSAGAGVRVQGRGTPEQQLGPVGLSFWYSYEWKSLPPVPRGADSSHFARGCHLGVSIGARKCFIQPTFLFSLPSSSQELIRFLSELEPDLPFTPKDEYFYRVVPKKSGTGERLVKLHRGWRSAT